jgi:hypothetical protein
MGINVQADVIVNEVKVYETGVNISAYSPAGKDPNGEWRVNPWVNLRPVRAIQDFARTLQKGDRIHAEGFIKAYLPKQKGAEKPKPAQYVVTQSISMQEQNYTQPATTGNEDELPF